MQLSEYITVIVKGAYEAGARGPITIDVCLNHNGLVVPSGQNRVTLNLIIGKKLANA